MVTTRRRSTNQRALIDAALTETSTFVSAQEFHGLLKEGGATIGMATVYRALQDAVLAGTADSIRSESGEMLYRHCEESGHHHHLICRRCGRTEEIRATSVERWAQSAAKEFGYVDVDHHLELFGLCAGCAVTD
ncbi:transcriptional repressor [Nakamurella silvestris]|nr:transcriptional repressor [Nakamurella silvestris]